ncbi:MAG: (d)CMP kinase [Acidimicrobiales bacterium]
MLITISGLPGSGTTTVSRLVAGALHLDRVPGGEVFRQLAAESGMSLAEFGEHAQDHPEIDRELDDRLEARAREGSCVIESRLAGWLAVRAELLAVRVWVDAEEGVRAARVAERDGTSAEEARRDNAERAALERGRYLAVYGIDLDDRAPYDVVLDSTFASAKDLADEVIDRARATFP